MADDNQTIDIQEILKLLPHRYPFVMVDRILEVDLGKSAVGLKNVTINEPFFQGHFPTEPVMPGVLILEGMAQVGGVLAYLTDYDKFSDELLYFAGLDGVRFRRKVVPGDQLVLEAQAVRVKSRTGHVVCRAQVSGEQAAEASIRFMLVDADPS